MSNINMKDIKDFCSEEREGIILKQKIKIQALEKENAELKKLIDKQLLQGHVAIKQASLLVNFEQKIKEIESQNKLLVEKLGKAKKSLEFVDYQFRCSLGDSDDMIESIKLARQTLKELE